MAKVFGVPEGVRVPEFTDYEVDGRDEFHFVYSRAKADQVDQQFIEDLKAKAQEMGYTGESVGEVIRFQVADGYAQYMVLSLSPPQLIHLPLMGGYGIPEAHARGLRAADLREEVRRGQAIAKLFGDRAAEKEASVEVS